MTMLATRTVGDLGKEANKLFHLAETHAHNAVEYAFQCGEHLAEIKAQLDHGQWLPWLDKHFDGSARKAQVYAQLAKANTQRSALPASLSQGLKAIAKSNDPEPKAKASTKHLGNLMKGTGSADEPIVDAEVIEGERDPEYVKINDQLAKVLAMLNEAFDLNEISALDKRRLASRQLTATARQLAGLVN